MAAAAAAAEYPPGIVYIADANGEDICKEKDVRSLNENVS